MRRVAVILGPTGVGKTGLGIAVARRLGGEIVGADSVQVYRGLDIGSAKPTAEERAAVPHHLVDVVDPAEPYTAADYQRDAMAAVEDIASRGRLPVVVGGTALYVRALLHGLCEAPAADAAFRADLAARAGEVGWPALHAELAQVDPDAAARIHPHDRVRIERALEVVHVTGMPLTRVQRAHGFGTPRLDALLIGLDVPREELVRRIDRRVEEMVAAGWFAEVESLLERGYDAGLKPLRAIGYRDVVACLQGRLEREEAIRRIQRDTRRFARRQMTWFLKEPGVRWYTPAPDLAETLVPVIRAFVAREE